MLQHVTLQSFIYFAYIHVCVCVCRHTQTNLIYVNVLWNANTTQTQRSVHVFAAWLYRFYAKRLTTITQLNISDVSCVIIAITLKPHYSPKHTYYSGKKYQFFGNKSSLFRCLIYPGLRTISPHTKSCIVAKDPVPRHKKLVSLNDVHVQQKKS